MKDGKRRAVEILEDEKLTCRQKLLIMSIIAAEGLPKRFALRFFKGPEIQSLKNKITIDGSMLTPKVGKMKEFIEIVEYLNKKSGGKFRAQSSKTQELIRARMREGFEVEDFKKVIDNMSVAWGTNEMANYLRPMTLFGRKFENYLNWSNGPSDPLDRFFADQGIDVNGG